jgi:nucleoside 2-deoxyribosyltransferase
MKAYISLSFDKRSSLSQVVTVINDCLDSFNITSLVFVDKYKFTVEQEKEMMATALQEIDSCDFLIAETSVKGIGIGVEAGYAKANHKPIIYLRHQQASHSTTVAGISDYQVIYTDSTDLEQQLPGIIKDILVQKLALP